MSVINISRPHSRILSTAGLALEKKARKCRCDCTKLDLKQSNYTGLHVASSSRRPHAPYAFLQQWSCTSFIVNVSAKLVAPSTGTRNVLSKPFSIARTHCSHSTNQMRQNCRWIYCNWKVPLLMIIVSPCLTHIVVPSVHTLLCMFQVRYWRTWTDRRYPAPVFFYSLLTIPEALVGSLLPCCMCL